MFSMLAEGFSQIMSVEALLFCLVGVVLGIFFGATPGMTSSMGIALLLPITYTMDIITGMSLLLGIYIGSISGGLITAILINIPGTPASIATTYDGYPMALRGEGGKAVRVATLYSLLGGLFSLIVLFFVAPSLADFALRFGPVEYFAIAVFSLTLISSLSGASIMKGIVSTLIGIMLTTVGMAPVDASRRFTFGIPDLDGGFELLPVMIGVFAVMEIIKSAENPVKTELKILNYKSKGIGVTFKEFVGQLKNFFISAGIGTGVGILPGLGGAITNFLAYSSVKNASKYPEKFGTGVIDGLVASETSNNAVSGGAMIPLLTMGIPGDAPTAILIAAFMLHGITPGPLLFKTNGNLIYAMFAILIVANIMMFVVQLYGLPFFLKLLSIPKNVLFPIIISLACLGAFALNNRLFDVWSITLFAILGYALSKFNFPSAPLVLGFVLGPMLELNLRRGLMSTYGNFWTFFTRPIASVFLGLTVLIVVLNVIKTYRKSKAAKAAKA